ncbi:TlpA family protein disulfide reductase [Nitrosococcus watsonii]|uniref:Signal peptide protein n=1 Tax=Nitrosococcus watsoni (strain C-113) TaxID=105559 RepID=D8KB96_NITWC|nr:TlpA disulfide reductase family protein [Nitrosococcus watsonii]ADJ29543.1 signal peptide protein [Nitrosococcus watsonii C-113]
MMTYLFHRVLKGALWLLALGVGAAAVAGTGTAPLPFESGSLEKILDSRADKPFLLVMWSLECPPCRKEMDLLAEMRRQHPKLDVVLVSTDEMERADQVAAAVKGHGLEKTESWLFAGPAQRLRYEIDPGWYGEMPRSYFYDANHERVAVSGALEEAQIQAWLEHVHP